MSGPTKKRASNAEAKAPPAKRPVPKIEMIVEEEDELSFGEDLPTQLIPEDLDQGMYGEPEFQTVPLSFQKLSYDHELGPFKLVNPSSMPQVIYERRPSDIGVMGTATFSNKAYGKEVYQTFFVLVTDWFEDGKRVLLKMSEPFAPFDGQESLFPAGTPTKTVNLPAVRKNTARSGPQFVKKR